MKTLRTYCDRLRCYACDNGAVGARMFHPVGEATQAAEAFERGDKHGCAVRPRTDDRLIAPACARHADTKIRIVRICTYCTGAAPRGLVIDGRVAHVSCEREDAQS